MKVVVLVDVDNRNRNPTTGANLGLVLHDSLPSTGPSGDTTTLIEGKGECQVFLSISFVYERVHKQVVNER